MKKIYTGKARDMYDVGDKIVMVASDRISMHIPLPFTVKNKGIVLTKMSEFWFKKTSHIIPNHMVSTDLNDMPKEFQNETFKDRSMLVKKLKMIPIECVVRGYITGSGWQSYLQDGTICGIKLRENLQESEKLDEPIFTPTTKMENGEDTNITFEELCHLIGEDLAEKVKDISIRLYNYGYSYALDKGIIIADTKFEFGIDENGTLTLADEILTPDSSRFWLLDTYEVGRKQTNFDRYELWNYDQQRKISNYNYNRVEIPKEIFDRISKKYKDIYSIITSKSLNEK